MDGNKSSLSAKQQEQIDNLVSLAAQQHGHLCPGQVIGVRMAISGLARLGYSCPLGYPDIKQVVGFVEIDRCLADAVGTATGLRMGRGSLKFVNQGLLAATFWDLATDRAIRVVSRDEARDLAEQYVSDAPNAHAAQTAAYHFMDEDELFDFSWVKVSLPPDEMPGARPPKVPCAKCGVLVRSGKVFNKEGKSLCAVCAGEAYFTPLD